MHVKERKGKQKKIYEYKLEGSIGGWQRYKKLLFSMSKNYTKGNIETAFAIKDKDGSIVVEPEEVAQIL